MTTKMFDAGLDYFGNWTTSAFRWLLLTGGTFNPDHATVAAVLASTGAAEPTVTGYARQAVAGKTRTVNTVADRVEYNAADPAFPGMDGGQTITALLLYYDTGSDSSSIPVAWWDINAPTGVPTNAAAPLEFLIPAGMIAYTEAA